VHTCACMRLCCAGAGHSPSNTVAPGLHLIVLRGPRLMCLGVAQLLCSVLRGRGPQLMCLAIAQLLVLVLRGHGRQPGGCCGCYEEETSCFAPLPPSRAERLCAPMQLAPSCRPMHCACAAGSVHDGGWHTAAPDGRRPRHCCQPGQVRACATGGQSPTPSKLWRHRWRCGGASRRDWWGRAAPQGPRPAVARVTSSSRRRAVTARRTGAGRRASSGRPRAARLTVEPILSA
jgi:hypothetical protein